MADETAHEVEYDESQPPAEGESRRPQSAAAAAGSDLPLKEGAVFGVGVFLLNYVVRYLMISSQYRLSGQSPDPEMWKLVGWYVVGSHGVELESAALGAIGSSSTGLISMLIPMVFLTVGAYGLVKYVNPDGLTESLKTAVTIAPAYLVLALLTAVATEYTVDGSDAAISLATGDALLYAGIVYPVVFGVIGALLVTWPKPVDRVMAKIDS